MLARYRREAKTAQELALGWLVPLHHAIPELAADEGQLERDTDVPG
jgi:hypothetical protein